MRAVGNFLTRFKHLKAPERSVRAAVLQAVKEVVGVDIENRSVKISGNDTLYLSPSSIIKSAIFEHKLEVLSRVNNILGKDQIKKIQ